MKKEDLVTIFFNNNNEFYFLHDLTGTIIEASDSVEHIIGYPPAALQNKNPYDYFHPDDLDIIQKQAHAPLLEHKSIAVECRFRKSDNNYLWVSAKGFTIDDEYGNPKNIFSILTPIDKVVNYRLEVTRKEMLMEQAGKMALIGAWEIDVVSKEASWSQVTYDIFDVDKAFRPKYESSLDFLLENDKETLKIHYSKASTLGLPFDCVMRITTARGSKKWIRTIGKPEILYGKTVKILGSFQDISNEIENQHSLKQAIVQLTNQKKQLLEFNQIVSHNLRTPVGNFGMLLSMLVEEEDEQERRLLTQNLFEVSDSLQTLLGELVDVVKITSNADVSYELLDLAEILENTRKILNGDIRSKNAQIETDFSWRELMYPKIYMESIFLNLLSNAIKYSSPLRAPKIVISTYSHHSKGKVLTFADNGSGIDMERNAHKVFKLHKTFHKDKPGKGLGLFMTKNQVEATGGLIEVESELDKGTTFSIIIKDKVTSTIL